MKTNPATLLLGIGIAALVIGAVVANETSAAPSTGPTKIDPAIGGYTLADADVLATSNPQAGQALKAFGVPPHAFVTTKNLGFLLAGDASNVGTVSAWIAKQNAAGHRVFMSPPLTSPSAPGQVGYVFMLDMAPSGYAEVTA